MFRIAPSRSLKVLVEQLGIDTDDDTDTDTLTLPEGRQLLLSSGRVRVSVSSSVSIPNCSVSTASDRDGAIRNTVVSGPTNTHHCP